MTRPDISRLEDLPDELFLLIGRYLSFVDILHGFSSLNRRLSKIIGELSRHINLNRIPSNFLSRFANEILPSIRSNVEHLTFADDYERFPLQLNEFDRLRSISISNSFSWNFLFNVEKLQIDLNQVDLETQKDLIEKLFFTDEFSRLKSLALNSFIGLTFSSYSKIRDSSIESLKITVKNNVDFVRLLDLLSDSIEDLDVHIVYNGPFEYSTLTDCQFVRLRSFHLKTTFEDSIKFQQLKDFLLQTFPSLERLSIETLTRDRAYVDGRQWEALLRQLPRLRHFASSIRFRFKLVDQIDLSVDDDDILHSFSSDFWLNERRWFVQFYRTVSSPADDQQAVPHYKTKNYGKLFLHTTPFPYASIDCTKDISSARSSSPSSIDRHLYRNVRQLHYDGENLPIELTNLTNLFARFRWINELKLDRLRVKINPFAAATKPIEFPFLTKLIVYPTANDEKIELKYFDFSASSSLRSLSCPHSSLPDLCRLPKQIESLILNDCRDYQYEWICSFPLLRSLRLHYSYFDRLVENHGQLIFNIIESVFPRHPTLESVQLMCHGTSTRKLQLFERYFHSRNLPQLSIKFDSKSLSVQRTNLFFS